MIGMPDFRRLIRPITNKIFLLLARSLLEAVENADPEDATRLVAQKNQVTALADETISDIERFQEYGLETYPETGAEAFVAFLNGNRDHGIVLCVHDTRYRPLDLSEGEVCLYNSADKENPMRITLKPDRTLLIECNDLSVIASNNIALAADNDVSITAGGNVDIDATGDVDIDATGNVDIDGTRIDLN